MGAILNHYTMPLRRIVRREIQAGRPFVVLACLHASPGVPASRLSRYYPCPHCDEIVRRHREAHAASRRKP